MSFTNSFQCSPAQQVVDYGGAFQPRFLSDQHALWFGRLPADLCLDSSQLDDLWSIRPKDFHYIWMHGRRVPTPRWQQAFGRDYRYAGQVNAAMPIPPILNPMLVWSREVIDNRLNGILVNWYDGERRHYIGKHRDSAIGVVVGSPIVTISLGSERAFRIRPWRGEGFTDFLMPSGTVIVMPYEVNRGWTHEVPPSRLLSGKRISVTLRAFVE